MNKIILIILSLYILYGEEATGIKSFVFQDSLKLGFYTYREDDTVAILDIKTKFNFNRNKKYLSFTSKGDANKAINFSFFINEGEGEGEVENELKLYVDSITRRVKFGLINIFPKDRLNFFFEFYMFYETNILKIGTNSSPLTVANEIKNKGIGLIFMCEYFLSDDLGLFAKIDYKSVREAEKHNKTYIQGGFLFKLDKDLLFYLYMDKKIYDSADGLEYGGVEFNDEIGIGIEITYLFD